MKTSVCNVFLFCTAAALALPVSARDGARDFGAYYTHISSDAPFEKYSRTGDFADVVVDMRGGQLVFWRGNSYLPEWKSTDGKTFYVDEIIERKGDGTGRMQDYINLFSNVKILETGKDKAVILWRYLPRFEVGNPRGKLDDTQFVNELYTLYPNGTVKRIIKPGTARYNDWADSQYEYCQTFRLGMEGITDKHLTLPSHSAEKPAIAGRTCRAMTVVEPKLCFNFDEGRGDITREAVTKSETPVKGNMTYWRKGVEGTALQFDDVSTLVSFPASKAPHLSSALTLEGWVAIGAYPWNWSPIVQQMDDASVTGNAGDRQAADAFQGCRRGYFLGISGDGHVGLKLRVGDSLEVLTSKQRLDLYRWYHVVGTYDCSNRCMRLYLNGEKVAERLVKHPADIALSASDIQIGRGMAMIPASPVGINTFPTPYSFDGLIDDVRIYDVPLTPSQVQTTFGNFKTNSDVLAKVDMEPRVLPGHDAENRFGAKYTCLHYTDTWDHLFRFADGSDVVVSFDNNPCKFVFWRGVSYIPMVVNGENQWYSDEFNETWNTSGGQGCQEAMSDKSSEVSHVRVIENTPARVVVQWRIALMDVYHTLANYDVKTRWNDFSDWYYYIYPDGVAARKMVLWTNGERNHEWQETMAILGPGQHPEDVIDRENTITMMNENGRSDVFSWTPNPPSSFGESGAYNIQLVNFKSDYDPFVMGTKFVGQNIYNDTTSYSIFSTWNHWPTAQIFSDGCYARFPDRPAHTSLSHVYFPIYKEDKTGDKPYYEKLTLEGMWNKPKSELAMLSKSWTHAPKLTGLQGATGGYEPEQRAYVLRVSSRPISFTVDASADHPIYNLCFVLKGWDTSDDAKIDFDPRCVKQGLLKDTDGTYTKLVYLQCQSEKSLEINIR